MFPIFTTVYLTDSRTMNTEQLGHPPLRQPGGGIHITNLTHLVLCENVLAMKNATRPRLRKSSGDRAVTHQGSSLLPHVFHVLQMGAQEQVRRVTTRRIVAGVKHKLFGRRTCFQFVGQPMGVKLGLVVRELPVSPGKSASLPFPALVRAKNENLGPEPFNVFGRENHAINYFRQDVHVQEIGHLTTFLLRRNDHGQTADHHQCSRGPV